MPSRKEVERLLQHYGVRHYQIEGDEIRSRCFIHGGDNPRALSIDYERGVYRCFTQDHSGHLIGAIQELEDLERYEAEKRFKEITGKDYETEGDEKPVSNLPYRQKISEEDKERAIENSIEVEHYRDFDTETLNRFGIRIGINGIFSDWVLIPIHDIFGNLSAFKMRTLNDRQMRYKVFPRGTNLKPLLYNAHRIKQRNNVLVLEGEFKAMKASEYGYPAVATMGSNLSNHQRQFLEDFDEVALMFDPDDAGRKAARKVKESLGTVVKVIECPRSAEPDELDEKSFHKLMRRYT